MYVLCLRISCSDEGATPSFSQFGDRADLLSQDPLGLAPLDFNELLWLVVIHDMNDGELSTSGLRQEARTPQSSMGPRREVCRCEDMHQHTPVC